MSIEEREPKAYREGMLAALIVHYTNSHKNRINPYTIYGLGTTGETAKYRAWDIGWTLISNTPGAWDWCKI